ncbi:MAG TPA: cation:proton antiporter [Candidatus Limnocylindria bacterium]|nr:cation:proton antiporter [Candidatus Limnocylindria bacterium]
MLPDRHVFALAWFVIPGLLSPPVAHAATEGGATGLQPILAALVLILIGAKLGGALFERFGQSAVLGELLAGIVIGNLGLLGVHGLEAVRDLEGIEILAQIGVLFLLFQVGLETDIQKMRAVGPSALLVAALGVVVPMVLGFVVSSRFFPDHHPLTHWFVGATLCATSVGITARVLADLQRTTSPEGSIILGAAVIDDVLGLIVLAVVSGIIAAADRGAEFQPLSVVWITAKALLFLAGALVLGRWASRRVFKLASRLPGRGLLISIAVGFCFALAYFAGIAGLAPIVGAFAAGLILDQVHYRELRARDRHDRSVDELLEPIAAFLVPIFFVLMGMRVDLSVFGAAQVLGFAALLTAAAVIGKQACSLGVLDRGADRLAVGLGMIPRGEVGLIFAGIGATLTIQGAPVVDGVVFSAIVVMVALTTLMTPPLLVWRLRDR